MSLGLTGRVVIPGDPGWDDARRNYNLRFDVHPRAVVFCQTEADVANALAWAREKDLPFRVCGGRHSYEGYSLVDGGLVIDLSEIDFIRLDRERGLVTGGAGVDMLHLVEALAQAGLTTPLATGPTVGLAGLALGGGFGTTSRKWGLTCDNVTAVEMIDAEGRRIRATGEEDPDLFWALRGGGGGNFGIATALTLRVYRAEPVALFAMEWPWEQAAGVLEAWQRWAPEAEDALASALRLTAARTLRMYGQFSPDHPGELSRLPLLLAPMFAAGTATGVTIQVVPAVIAARLFFAESMDPRHPRWPLRGHMVGQAFKSTCAAAMEPLGPGGVETLIAHLEDHPVLSIDPPDVSMVQLLGGGGAVARVAPGATAAFYRQAKFIVQYNGFWMAPQDAPAVMQWVSHFRRTMLPYTRGAYVNYADGDLERPLEDYYGENLPRLRAVKRRHDPEDVFRFPQSIPPAARQDT